MESLSSFPSFGAPGPSSRASCRAGRPTAHPFIPRAQKCTDTCAEVASCPPPFFQQPTPSEAGTWLNLWGERHLVFIWSAAVRGSSPGLALRTGGVVRPQSSGCSPAPHTWFRWPQCEVGDIAPRPGDPGSEGLWLAEVSQLPLPSDSKAAPHKLD